MNEVPRRTPGAALKAGRALRGTGSVLAVLATLAVLIVLLAGRGQPGAGGIATGSPGSAEVAVAISLEPSAITPSSSAFTATSQSPPPAIPTPSPEPEPTASPTPRATAEPTPDPTPEPTPAPTKRPTATPQPTHDPAPEPTPTTYRASGAFGSTLTAGGVDVFLARHAPSADPNCASAESSLQGHTQVASFELRITWSKPAEATEPFVAVGTKPFFNVQWYDPPSFKSGGTYVSSTCVRPGDDDVAVVSFESNGGAPRSYRFTFR